MQHLKVTRVHFPLGMLPWVCLFASSWAAKVTLRKVRLEGRPVGCPLSVLKVGKGLLDGTSALIES